MSTTQVCTGSIFGAGAGLGRAAVHWGLAGRMAVTWAVTLPAAAAMGAVASVVAAHGASGMVAVAVGGVALGGGIHAASRRNPVSALNVNDVPTPPPVRAVA